MRFHAFSTTALALIFILHLASCGEMELPAAPLDKDETSAPEASDSDNESTGPGASVSDEDSAGSGDILPPPSAAIAVEAFPAPCSVWRDHVVALVASIEGMNRTNEVVITLISLYDWPNLPSALNEAEPTLAATIAQGYQEYELSNWRIPTATEAKALKAAYTPSQSSGQILGGHASELLNSLLTSIAASTIQVTDEKGTPVRYLCEEAQKTFSFAPNTTIAAAGTKTTSYRLRLIKTLRLKLNQ